MSLWFITLGTGLGVLGAVLVYAGGTRFLAAYHVFADEPIPVAELTDQTGPAEIRGTTRPEGGETVRAPLTETECLAYEYEIRERRQAGEDPVWVEVDTGRDGHSFLVVDDTGTVQVRPMGAELRLDGQRDRVAAGEELPESVTEYLETAGVLTVQQGRLGLTSVDPDDSTDREVVERRLDPGESVRVYGQVEGAPATGEERVPARMAEGAASPLVVSDSPERETAWQVLRRPLFRLAIGVVVLVVGVLALLLGL